MFFISASILFIFVYIWLVYVAIVDSASVYFLASVWLYSTKSNYGKEAITHYSAVKNNRDYSLLQVFIDTGRRNQIRVHLSERGYPIADDKKYKCKTNPIKRLCLHANILEFIHPVSKKLIHIECDIPSEFRKII